jgi:PAS domain S-box-containing protein
MTATSKRSIAAVSTRSSADRRIVTTVAGPDFRALVDNAPDAIVISREGVVLYANAAAAALLGHASAADLVGKPMTIFLDPRSLEVMRRRIRQMLDGGERLVPREYPARRVDGTEITAEIVSTFVDFDGAPAVLAYARDVTDRARLRAQLAHADRLASLGMLAAGIAHEINNPLTFVGLAAEMLGRRVGEGEAPLVDEIRSGTERIAAIVRDLRLFGRYEDEVPGHVDVAAAIHAAERLVSHEIRPRATLVKEFDALPAAIGVGRRIEQVFVNLLLNAAHALEDKADGRIVVSAHATQTEVVVSVADDGVGIPEDRLAHVFEPFFTTRAVQGGTGLGLSICRDIVVRAGGNLVARSVEGQGTTMVVTLLRAAPLPAPTPEPSAPASEVETKRKRLLVVDDEPLIVSALVTALKRKCDVVGETDPARALERLLAGEAFDAVVCDVMMPGMSGVELHERVARQLPEVAARFVFITGGTYTARERDYLERAPNPHIHKPFETPELIRAIDRRSR